MRRGRAVRSLPRPLIKVRDRIEKWRRTRAGQCRMPEALWDAAVAVARVHGVNPVAKAARLDYYSLKGRLEGKIDQGQEIGREGPVFVDLGVVGAPQASEQSECEIELEEGSKKMSIRFRSTDAETISRVAMTFWGERR